MSRRESENSNISQITTYFDHPYIAFFLQILLYCILYFSQHEAVWSHSDPTCAKLGETLMKSFVLFFAPCLVPLEHAINSGFIAPALFCFFLVLRLTGFPQRRLSYVVTSRSVSQSVSQASCGGQIKQ